MTSTVDNSIDIDKKLNKILCSLDSNIGCKRDTCINVKSLIREVAEEVITTKTKRAMNDYENGWNDCVDTCNENLNKILGKENI